MTDPDDTSPAHVRLGNRALVIVEDAVSVSIAVLLAVGAGLLVVRAGLVLARGATDPRSDAFIDTLDAILRQGAGVSARAVVEVGLLGVLVLVLTGTTVLLRKEPEEDSGADPAAAQVRTRVPAPVA